MTAPPHHHAVGVRRVYDPPARGDGLRVLVDRLWPRGLKKAQAAIDLWVKEAAPSTELRRWFGHEPARFDEFKARYAGELRARPEGLAKLRALHAAQDLTLLFAAHDEAHNNAVALRDILMQD
ncbi:DUF488 domain-containing protein [Acidiphilium sp.]|uniref:DUF488 domain-containing protein n=1 Tax=Acidiphilium sp. TaxID=527 RepID=UPI002587F629|nr:DUF488 family protein [Acidiphilium sp.]